MISIWVYWPVWLLPYIYDIPSHSASSQPLLRAEHQQINTASLIVQSIYAVNYLIKLFPQLWREKKVEINTTREVKICNRNDLTLMLLFEEEIVNLHEVVAEELDQFSPWISWLLPRIVSDWRSGSWDIFWRDNHETSWVCLTSLLIQDTPPLCHQPTWRVRSDLILLSTILKTFFLP